MNESTTKRKQVLASVLIAISILLLILLAFFRSDLTEYISGEVQKNALFTIDKENIDRINKQFNYAENNLYDYTFLEFGAQGCVACRKMEYVMKYIDSLYQNVNVIFNNVRDKKNSKYADYYGVVMIPTQVILDKNGVEIFRHTGYISEYELEKIFIEK